MVVVLIAVFCYCPVGAFVTRKRHNPAAKIGLPEMIIGEKRRSFGKEEQRLELKRWGGRTDKAVVM